MKKRVYVVPHTHFDAEVFMSREDTLQLGFSNLQMVMYLFKTDPDFRFSLDQVCYVEPYLRRHPEEREFLSEMVRCGRLEITGGMHVMPDVNIPSGESIIRQALYGRRYFDQTLGVDVKAGWTLDSFGHHPQVPQLMAKCGFDYTIFQRLMKKDGPSEFFFKGLDGTKLPCHWMPASYAVLHHAPGNLHEFKAHIEPRLMHLEAHTQTDSLLLLTGADLTPPDPVLPAMIKAYNACQDKYELVFASSKDFFDAIDWEGDIPIIEDDLNPVFQGCYSARIEVKQHNRQAETILLDWEKTDAMNNIIGVRTSSGRIGDAWEKVLFNQFHDIICGSHVDEVFYATMSRYDQAESEATLNLERNLQSITAEIDTSGAGIPIVVFNTLCWERDDVVECSVVFSDPDVYEIEIRNAAGTLVQSDLTNVERFATGGIKKAEVLFIAKGVPSYGYEVYRILPASGETVETTLRTSHPLNLREDKKTGFLENEYYRLNFDLWNGTMDGFFDKQSDWEVLPRDFPFGNTVVKEQDFGNFWQYNGPCKGDAFHPFDDRYPLPGADVNNVDYSHRYLGDGSIKTGRAFSEFRIAHPFGSGRFSTRVRVYDGLRRIDIRTTLLNNDERVRYRAVLPTSIYGGAITHEIPFGAIERPEGEFPAQNWISYSDGEKSVSLLNRGLPGNNVVDGVMLLSLLKCTALKEGYAEVGGFKLGVPTERGYEKGIEHVFEYAYMTHAGDWREANSARRGMEYNSRLLAINAARHTGKLPTKKSFIRCSSENLILSSVKPADGGVLIRVYESEGRAASNATIELDFPISGAEETDLVERSVRDRAAIRSGNSIDFNIGAFEIKTFKLLGVGGNTNSDTQT